MVTRTKVSTPIDRLREALAELDRAPLYAKGPPAKKAAAFALETLEEHARRIEQLEELAAAHYRSVRRG